MQNEPQQQTEPLSFFPTPLPDESLHSLIIRYHILSASSSKDTTSKKLFNRRCFIHANNTSDLKTLSKRIPGHTDKLYKTLLENHTFHRIITRFSSPVKEIYLTGINSLTARDFALHRACPDCITEDVMAYGIFYWHRSHQVPGVICCWKHNSILISPSRGYPCPILPTSEKIAHDAYGSRLGEKIKNNSIADLKYARLAKCILNESLPELDQYKIYDLINYKIWKKGNIIEEVCIRESIKSIAPNSKTAKFIGSPTLPHIKTLHTQIYPSIRENLALIALTFDDFCEFSTLAKNSTASNKSTEATNHQTDSIPDWKWFNRRIAMYGRGTEDELKAIHERLSKFDKEWFNELSKISAKLPYLHEEHVQQEALSFEFKTTYLLQH